MMRYQTRSLVAYPVDRPVLLVLWPYLEGEKAQREVKFTYLGGKFLLIDNNFDMDSCWKMIRRMTSNQDKPESAYAALGRVVTMINLFSSLFEMSAALKVLMVSTKRSVLSSDAPGGLKVLMNRSRPSNRALTLMLLSPMMASGCVGGLELTSIEAQQERQVAFSEAIETVVNGGHGALFELVESFSEARETTPGVNSHIDYHYIRDASQKVLVQMYEQELAARRTEKARKHLEEALKIDPDNRKLLTLEKQLQSSQSIRHDPYDHFTEISPTSEAASTFNSIFLRRVRFHLGYRARSSNSQDDFSEFQSDLLRNRFSWLAKGKQPVLRLPSSESFAAFEKAFKKRYGLEIYVHPSLEDKFNKQLRYRGGGRTPLQLLAYVAKKVDANFVLGQEKIYAFAGSKIPSDLGGSTSAAFVRAEHVEAGSVISALRAYGFGPNILQVDNANNLIWIRGTYGEYVQAVLTVAAVDLPRAEIILDVEIVEVQTSLVNHVGARLPQLIDLNVGDPTFTIYGNSPVIANHDTIVNIPTTGGVTLANLLRQATPNVLRAVLRDPAAQLAARSSNFHVELTSKPTLRLRNRERARIHVGDRIPAFTTTASGTGFVSESVSYVDSGLKLDVDAAITADSEVTIGLSIESNNFIKEVRSPNGTSSPQLSSRLASTKLSVRDGDTVYLGGLISSDKRLDRNGVPGLGSTKFSFIGGSREDTGTIIELMVFVTPTIVRRRVAPARSFIGNFRDDAVQPTQSAQPTQALRTTTNTVNTGSIGGNTGAAPAAQRPRQLPTTTQPAPPTQGPGTGGRIGG